MWACWNFPNFLKPSEIVTLQNIWGSDCLRVIEQRRHGKDSRAFASQEGRQSAPRMRADRRPSEHYLLFRSPATWILDGRLPQQQWSAAVFRHQPSMCSWQPMPAHQPPTSSILLLRTPGIGRRDCSDQEPPGERRSAQRLHDLPRWSRICSHIQYHIWSLFLGMVQICSNIFSFYIVCLLNAYVFIVLCCFVLVGLVQLDLVMLGPTDPRQALILGGVHPDHSRVVSQQGRPEKEHLAQVHHCTYLKRIDTRTGGYIIQQIPRAKVTNAQAELVDFANLVDCCVKACGDEPPLVLATDCHNSYDLCHKLLLGQLTPDAYKDLPALRHLKPASQQVQAPMFAFRCMVFKTDSRPIFGSSDAKHIIKSVSRALRCASRCFQMCLELLCFSDGARYEKIK